MELCIRERIQRGRLWHSWIDDGGGLHSDRGQMHSIGSRLHSDGGWMHSIGSCWYEGIL